MNDHGGTKPEVEVFHRLLDHPIPPVSLSDVVAQGEAERRRRRHYKTFAAVAGTLVVAAGSTVAIQSVSSDKRGEDSISTPADATTGDTPAALDCPTVRSGSGTVDIIAPESVEQAREEGWPATADEAAQGTLSAPAFTELGTLTLSDGAPVELPGASDGVRYYAVNGDGATLAILTAEELLPNVWAITQIERCA